MTNAVLSPNYYRKEMRGKVNAVYIYYKHTLLHNDKNIPLLDQ